MAKYTLLAVSAQHCTVASEEDFRAVVGVDYASEVERNDETVH